MEPALLFLHLLGGAAWLGGSVLANVVLVPHVFSQAPDRQRDLISRVLMAPERPMIAAALTMGVSGVTLGVLGPISSVDALGTSYGLVWLASVAVIGGVFGVGGTVTSPSMRRLIRDDHLWRTDPASEAARLRLVSRLHLGFRLELAGLVLALALMVALRYA